MKHANTTPDRDIENLLNTHHNRSLIPNFNNLKDEYIYLLDLHEPGDNQEKLSHFIKRLMINTFKILESKDLNNKIKNLYKEMKPQNDVLKKFYTKGIAYWIIALISQDIVSTLTEPQKERLPFLNTKLQKLINALFSSEENPKLVSFFSEAKMESTYIESKRTTALFDLEHRKNAAFIAINLHSKIKQSQFSTEAIDTINIIIQTLKNYSNNQYSKLLTRILLEGQIETLERSATSKNVGDLLKEINLFINSFDTVNTTILATGSTYPSNRL